MTVEIGHFALVLALALALELLSPAGLDALKAVIEAQPAPGPLSRGFAVFCLEIFVAFLQAYVFTFLVVVFLGGALHPH